MVILNHKEYVLPVIDVSRDDGEPGWKNGQFQSAGTSGHTVYVRQPGLYQQIFQDLADWWSSTVDAYEADPGSFYNAWHYVNEHPVFWKFRQLTDFPPNHIIGLEHGYAFEGGAVSVTVVKVDETRTHTGTPADRYTEIWLESGKWDLFPEKHDPREGSAPFHSHYHDYELDCGGATYEQAVVRLAGNIWNRYGNDRRIADAPYDPDAHDAPDRA